jgi:hypothetical protein
MFCLGVIKEREERTLEGRWLDDEEKYKKSVKFNPFKQFLRTLVPINFQILIFVSHTL